MNNSIYALGSVIFVSLIAFIGLLSLSFGPQKIRHSLIYVISFAAGVLLGNAPIHLLPTAFANRQPFMVSLYTLGGIVTLFTIEKLFYWRQCHHIHKQSLCKHIHAHGITNLIGDSLHNMIDGIIIAGSYLVSVPIGITTTLTVALHEIPQEVSDFGILLHAGFSVRQALTWNFISGIFAIFGALIVFAFAPLVPNFTTFLIPFTAGSFIYIACCNLIPKLLKEPKLHATILQITCLLAGIGMIIGLKLIV